MPDSLYLATNENASGKRMVALGVMELAMRRFSRVVFFRPVVHANPADDQSIRLMRTRYRLAAIPDQMHGVTRQEARRMLAEDRYDELIQRIQQRFKRLQASADFAVVEGTSFQGLATEIEFELNADIAVNLGCAIMSIYSAANHSVEESVQSIRIGNDSLIDHGGQLLATIVNQVPADQRAKLSSAYDEARLTESGPIYVLPEEPLLRQPTVREIQAGLGARVLGGDEHTFDREVARLKVAAMLLPDFLQRLKAGSLVITPGDRSDIILGCALASLDASTPSPAGLVLTGGMLPPPVVLRMVNPTSGLPILTTDADTFTTATQASSIRAEIGEHSPRKIESAIGLFERNIDIDDLARRLEAPSVQRVTPMLFEHSLIERARQNRVRIVLPEGSDPRILQAVDVLRRRDVADIVLLGDPDQIRSAASQVGVSLDENVSDGAEPSEGKPAVEIINPARSPLLASFAEEYYRLRKHKGVTRDVAHDRMQEVSYFGTMMVRRGLAGGMVSGALHTTAATIRPAFEFIKTRPGIGCVSSVFLMCLRNGVLVYGDCAVVPNPTADELVEIASCSADTAAQFGIEPRIAMLSYSTGESGRGADVDRVRSATAMLKQARPELLVEGPLQYDAAVDPAVAAQKLPGSKVAGHATVFIFPDLNTGNNTYKAVQRSAGALAIGPVLQGLRRPVNDLSRGCTVADIVNTVAITAVQAQASHAIELDPVPELDEE
ncbi:phosphate acetyltransferase [Allorhodopirellula heiligendammensis]|uniref:Phosphate acetyltransferase n=1 Tax=Allorhodopirellula heiligendammensis TaxID=2714739 RepID=A0A5C6BDF0_9BACT|nr:phosphate acetyltransferase [Allorhodopirellula heiligendammensis]TWU10245.1 Phosphate acetyltransferase [Allorhodopirellula heiligendammensis]